MHIHTNVSSLHTVQIEKRLPFENTSFRLRYFPRQRDTYYETTNKSVWLIENTRICKYTDGRMDMSLLEL